MPDTIAAVATGASVSAIGIIRVSGDDAIAAADKIFRGAGRVRLADAQARRMYYGELSGADGGIIDLCLCMVSRKPDSYTGEDSVEFHCHGSPVVLSEVLRALSAHGVRQAQAGEFSKRAFLNGRMDLTQAEAVIDLIEAETPLAARNAAGQLSGAVGIRLGCVYSSLLEIMAHFHAVLDYPDEDIDDFKMQDYIKTLMFAEENLARMMATHERGRVLRNGIPVAIAGRPNTGKSSLLNALVGFERAIVTDIPWTTRDTVEEKILAGGLLLKLIDTAGLRNAEEPVEKHGVKRTLAAIRKAGLVLLVLDGSEELKEEDYAAWNSIPGDVPSIVVINKSDLPNLLTPQLLSTLPSQPPIPNSKLSTPIPQLLKTPAPAVRQPVRVSALTGDGLDMLVAEIIRLFPEADGQADGEIITNTRQFEAISRARSAICEAIAAINASVTPDAVLTEVEAALSAIGEVTGKTVREDITGRIFERFCVGK